MFSLDRRELLQTAGLVALSSFLPSPSRALSDAKTTFMTDAIKDIRKENGQPIDDVRLPVPPPPRCDQCLIVKECVPVPFADFDWYYTDGVIYWLPNDGQNLPAVVVPSGFCTDLATIPQFFWSFGLPPTGRYAWAAIVHDFLYWDQTVATREQANEILYTAMLDSGVPTITREAINLAVSVIPFFSRRAWDRDTAAKQSGEKRFLAIYPPRDRIVSWLDWSRDASHFKD
jgi:hypothetical protein